MTLLVPSSTHVVNNRRLFKTDSAASVSTTTSSSSSIDIGVDQDEHSQHEKAAASSESVVVQTNDDTHNDNSKKTMMPKRKRTVVTFHDDDNLIMVHEIQPIPDRLRYAVYYSNAELQIILDTAVGKADLATVTMMKQIDKIMDDNCSNSNSNNNAKEKAMKQWVQSEFRGMEGFCFGNATTHRTNAIQGVLHYYQTELQLQLHNDDDDNYNDRMLQEADDLLCAKSQALTYPSRILALQLAQMDAQIAHQYYYKESLWNRFKKQISRRKM